MDDDLNSIEAELRALAPSAPRSDLLVRIEAELDGPAQPRFPWAWAAAVLPIAAAVAFLAAFASRNAFRDTGEEGVLKPVSVENVLYAASDDGIVTLEDGTAARRQRLAYIDTVTWENPRTRARLTWSVPREEVRVVPVNYQ